MLIDCNVKRVIKFNAFNNPVNVCIGEHDEQYTPKETTTLYTASFHKFREQIWHTVLINREYIDANVMNIVDAMGLKYIIPAKDNKKVIKFKKLGLKIV